MMRYAPLADTRLVAAVFGFPAYAAQPTRRERVSRRGPRRGSGAGLDAGASGDYRAWPSKDGKPQRPAAGQGSGSRALPAPDASSAMGSLPRRPDPQHTARRGKDRSTYPGSAATHERRGGTLPPHGPPAAASASSGTCVRRLSLAHAGPAPAVHQHRGSPGLHSCLRWWPARRGRPAGARSAAGS